MGETPKDPIDELVRRSMKDAPGAPASFRSRINAQVAAEQQQARRARVIRIQAAVAVAAVIVLALAIGLNIELFLPKQQPEPQPQARTNADAQPTEDAGEEAPQQPEPQPDDQPEEQPKPQPEPEDEPNVPDQVEQPEPEPENQPEAQPEPKPEPEPEDVVEEPKPQPKPEDVVEEPQPGPKEPEPTTPNDAARWIPVNMGRVLTEGARVRPLMGEWADLKIGDQVSSKCTLEAGREPIDIELDGGGLLRFDGTIWLDYEKSSGAFLIGINDDSVYVDNLDTGRELRVNVQDIVAKLPDGAGFFEIDRGGLNAACIHGDLTLQDESVGEGKQRRATERGVQGEKDFRGDRLLNDLPARVLVRYEFDEAPPGGMYEDGERLEDGVAVMDQAPRYIGFRHDQTLKVLPGTVVRIRLRATNVSRLELEQFTPDNALMFKHTWAPEKDGDWIEVELRLEDISEYENAERHIQPGNLLRNFKLHYVGDKLELDWVEFTRVQS